jgi:class 3 adenylate cyclase
VKAKRHPKNKTVRPIRREKMKHSATALVKYVFVDVVGFTRGRSVEAQTDIVTILGVMIRATVRQRARRLQGTLYMPTGDGLCVAITDARAPFDIHLSIAIDILGRVDGHNVRSADQMRRFQIRVGIAENVDNLFADINGNRNVAGAGVNTAQRVMSIGDGCQILASQNVFESLRHRERYQNTFRSLIAGVKHDVTLPVNQFIEQSHAGLSTALPSAFARNVPPLKRLEAYLLAHALKHETFFASKPPRGQMRSAANVLLYFLACDSEGLATETPSRPYNLQSHRAGRATLEEQCNYYMGLDFAICHSLSDRLLEQFKSRAACFREDGFLSFVSDAGRSMLYDSFPEIWAEFGLGEPPNKRLHPTASPEGGG